MGSSINDVTLRGERGVHVGVTMSHTSHLRQGLARESEIRAPGGVRAAWDSVGVVQPPQ